MPLVPLRMGCSWNYQETNLSQMFLLERPSEEELAENRREWTSVLLSNLQHNNESGAARRAAANSIPLFSSDN